MHRSSVPDLACRCKRRERTRNLQPVSTTCGQNPYNSILLANTFFGVEAANDSRVREKAQRVQHRSYRHAEWRASQAHVIVLLFEQQNCPSRNSFAGKMISGALHRVLTSPCEAGHQVPYTTKTPPVSRRGSITFRDNPKAVSCQLSVGGSAGDCRLHARLLSPAIIVDCLYQRNALQNHHK